MQFWTEKTAIDDPSETQLREALLSENFSNGCIAQLEATSKDYLHTMAFNRPTGGLGFYIERRGPSPDDWFAGVTPGRAKVIISKPWWMFWVADIETHLFDLDEMVAIFCQHLRGETHYDWVRIPPSYED